MLEYDMIIKQLVEIKEKTKAIKAQLAVFSIETGDDELQREKEKYKEIEDTLENYEKSIEQLRRKYFLCNFVLMIVQLEY